MPPKKLDKAPAKPESKPDPFVDIVTLMVGAFIALYIINGIIGMFAPDGVFSRGIRGLTPQGIMQAHTRSIASLDNPINTNIVSMIDGTSVYDSPNGNQVGTQPFNARGNIIQGAVISGSDSYWYVDFNKGSDGWVNEKDIAFLNSEPTFWENVVLWLWSSVPYFKIFFVLLSLAIIAFIAYIVIKLTAIRKNQHALVYPILAEADEPEKNLKWEKILAEADSLNENDWKLAIIEADIILSDILDKLHLPGDTIGDKMKAVEKSDFTTIDNAWEAHKIRNQIAHEGSEFVLSQHEVRRVINLYKTIFEEFQVI